MLLIVWGEGSSERVTRDADLLGFGDHSPTAAAAAFRDICAVAVEDDGVHFEVETIAGFASDPLKQTQGKAFWRKVVRTEPTPEFVDVVELARRFLLPAAEAARVGSGSPGHWTKGGPWREP